MFEKCKNGEEHGHIFVIQMELVYVQGSSMKIPRHAITDYRPYRSKLADVTACRIVLVRIHSMTSVRLQMKFNQMHWEMATL